MFTIRNIRINSLYYGNSLNNDNCITCFINLSGELIDRPHEGTRGYVMLNKLYYSRIWSSFMLIISSIVMYGNLYTMMFLKHYLENDISGFSTDYSEILEMTLAIESVPIDLNLYGGLLLLSLVASSICAIVLFVHAILHIGEVPVNGDESLLKSKKRTYAAYQWLFIYSLFSLIAFNFYLNDSVLQLLFLSFVAVTLLSVISGYRDLHKSLVSIKFNKKSNKLAKKRHKSAKSRIDAAEKTIKMYSKKKNKEIIIPFEFGEVKSKRA